jgi:hypothetical protein
VLCAVGFVLSFYAWWPMVWMRGTPELDGRYGYQMVLIGKAAIQNFGEFPMWNPYDCRGIPLWDHPEGMTSSFLLLLLTPIGGLATFWLWNWLHMAVGWAAAWVLFRDDYNLSRLASFAGACMWVFGCCHTTQYCGAHESFAALWLFPLQLLLWRRSERSTGAAIGLGALFAFLIYDGTTYPLPLTALVLVIEALLRGWPPIRLVRIARGGVIVAASGFTLSAARLLPLLDQLAMHKRVVGDTDSLAHWNTLGAMWTHHEVNWLLGLPDQQYVWGEYFSYIGFVSALVAIVGMFIAIRKEWRTALLAAIVFVLMLGHFHKWAPWHLLREHVPPFTSMRVPGRFRLLFQLFIALFVALTVEHVGRRSRALRVGAIALAFIGIGDMIGFGFDIVTTRFHGPPVAPIVASPRFYYGGDVSPDFADAVRQNRGWLGCRSYEWPANSDAPIWEGDVPQVRAFDDGAVVSNASRTSSTFTATVEATRDTTIILNSGYASGWVSNVGQTGINNKMLSVKIPAGHHDLHVRYWPRHMTLGLEITAVGLLGVGAWIAWRLVRRRRRPSA